MPGPELIASGTEATPQLLTFGKISGSPATGGGASKPSSSKAAAPASSTVAVKPSSSKAAAPVSSAVAVKPSSSSAVAGAITTPAGNSTAEPTPIVTPVQPSAPALTPPVVSDSFSTTIVAPAPSTLVTAVRPKPTQGGSTGSIQEWAQCGGNGFKGTASCASGLECKEWNPYYSQCIKSEGASNNPTTTKVAPAPSATAPSATAPAQSEPTAVIPTDNEPAEKTYTLETFVAWLEENAGSESAAKIRRMIEALQ
jgi:cellulase